MTLEELQSFTNTHLFKLASEKFHKMSELEEKGATVDEIHPYLTDIRYILSTLRERGMM